FRPLRIAFLVVPRLGGLQDEACALDAYPCHLDRRLADHAADQNYFIDITHCHIFPPMWGNHHALRNNSPDPDTMRGLALGCAWCATREGPVMILATVPISALAAAILRFASSPETACGGIGTSLPSMICAPGGRGLPFQYVWFCGKSDRSPG